MTTGPFIGDTVTIIITLQDRTGAALDISTATLKEIAVKRLSDDAEYITAAFVTDGEDGQIQIDYEDMTAAGQYQVQGYVVIGGNPYHSSTSDFSVKAPLS